MNNFWTGIAILLIIVSFLQILYKIVKRRLHVWSAAAGAGPGASGTDLNDSLSFPDKLLLNCLFSLLASPSQAPRRRARTHEHADQRGDAICKGKNSKKTKNMRNHYLLGRGRADCEWY